MIKKICLPLLLACLLSNYAFCQTINPKNITIIRDNWGVPHIYANTDAEVAYGLAWANSEDDFHTMQEIMLALRGKFSAVKGKNGALLDAVAFFIDVNRIVEEQYDTAFTDDFKKILEGYAEGYNSYAATHPKEVRHKSVATIEAKDIIKGYVLQMTFISNVHYDLVRIFESTIIQQEEPEFTRGSNAWAISPGFSEDGSTFLVSNTHQPLRGPGSWYECHVSSKEGWNFYGGTFPGGVTPFVGTNPHLGWTHTTNYDDFNDVYKLEMHPAEKNKYKFDGEWLELEERVLKLNVKLGPIKLPIKRKFYWSKYGPTLKNKKHGFYSLRFPSMMKVNMAEQWYNMNKATSLEEFMAAINMQSFANQNVIYADGEGNILFIGNGLFPYRNPDKQYNWPGVLPGNTSATLWEKQFMPLDSLIMVVNPGCGYVFNTNNTSYNCTCPEENPKPVEFNHTIGYQPKDNARSVRLQELIQVHDKLSYNELKVMKYDSKFPEPLYTRTIENFEDLLNLDPKQYPHIADVIGKARAWDYNTDIHNEHAAVISLAIQYILKHIRGEGIADYNNTMTEEIFVEALEFAKKHLVKHFGTVNIKLGQLQKHVRGDIVLPIWGMPEVLTQMYTKEWKKGMYQSHLGDSFIMFITFNENGELGLLETMMPYGNSKREDSPHYTDQMKPYINKQLKQVSMDREVIMQQAENVYHPE